MLDNRKLSRERPCRNNFATPANKPVRDNANNTERNHGVIDFTKSLQVHILWKAPTTSLQSILFLFVLSHVDNDNDNADQIRDLARLAGTGKYMSNQVLRSDTLYKHINLILSCGYVNLIPMVHMQLLPKVAQVVVPAKLRSPHIAMPVRTPKPIKCTYMSNVHTRLQHRRRKSFDKPIIYYGSYRKKTNAAKKKKKAFHCIT